MGIDEGDGAKHRYTGSVESVADKIVRNDFMKSFHGLHLQAGQLKLFKLVPYKFVKSDAGASRRVKYRKYFITSTRAPLAEKLKNL